MKIIRQLKEDVGSTILSQIKTLDPRAIFAWGARNFAKNGPNSGIIGFMHLNDGYLMFDVNCPKFKGKVVIMLMFDDTYFIVFGTVRSGSWTIKKVLDDIYAEDLVRVIDDFVG